MNQYEYWLQQITDAGIYVNESALSADDNLDGLYAAQGDKQIIFVNSHRTTAKAGSAAQMQAYFKDISSHKG